jgi:hypothetical protein
VPIWDLGRTEITYTVPAGPPGPPGPPGPTYPTLGRVAVVDSVNGDDVTGSINGPPFLTVEAAIAAVAAVGAAGYTVWVLPGTYTLLSGITLPAGCSLRGLSLQTVTLQIVGATSATTLLTMGENTRIEDCTLKITTSSALATPLVGIECPGQTAQTSKVRTVALTIDNSAVPTGSVTNVYAARCSGSNVSTEATFSFNVFKGSTFTVKSNGGGAKRAILLSGSAQASTRDMNLLVDSPADPASTGTYVAVECANATGLIALRSTAVRGAPDAGSYTGSDILQTLPVTQSATAGIQIGPGTDLNTKTAGGKAFRTFVTPTTIDYGLRGNVSSSTQYYWLGNQTIGDATEVFYRFQQPALVNGLSATLRVPPGGGVGVRNITLTVRKSTTAVPGSGVPTLVSVTFTDGDIVKVDLDHSVRFDQGEYLSLQSSVTGGAGTAADMTVQIDVF